MATSSRAKLTLRQQASLLEAEIQGSEAFVWNGQMVWEGWVQPVAGGRKYKLCINYRSPWFDAPQVYVVSPPLNVLNMRKVRRMPHSYSEGFLCLYWPEEEEWSASSAIAKTMLPWAALWTYYYEEYRLSGAWKGEGRHPTDPVEETVAEPIDEFAGMTAASRALALLRRGPPKPPKPPLKCIRLKDLKLQAVQAA